MNTTETKPVHGSPEDNIEILKVFHTKKIDPLAWARWYVDEASKRRRPSVILAQYRDEAMHIITSNNARNPRVYGSIARGQDTVNSDVNFLVDARECSMLDLAHIRNELQKLLGVPVSITPADTTAPQMDQAAYANAIALAQFPK